MFEWVGTIAGAVVGFGGSWLLLFSQQRRQEEGVRRQLSALFGDLSTYMLRKSDWNVAYLEQWDQAFTRLRHRVYSPDVAASIKPDVAVEAYGVVRFCEDVLNTAKRYKPRPADVPGSTKHHFEHRFELLQGAIQARTIQMKLGDKAAKAQLPDLFRLRKEQIAPLAGKSAEVTHGLDQKIDLGP